MSPAAPDPASVPATPMSPAAIRQFFQTLASSIRPETELRYHSPLDLAIAVVLSAQATDVSVNLATEELFRRCRTAADYLALGEAGLTEYIRTIGLFRRKAKAIIGLCQILVERYEGRLPETREELEALPGVGRKTANVLLNTLFNQPTLAVDTHIFRVANRIGMVKAKTPKATEEALLRVIPPEYLKDAHHYLLLHGRYTCKAARPLCPTCPVNDICGYPARGGDDLAPRRRPGRPRKHAADDFADDGPMADPAAGLGLGGTTPRRGPGRPRTLSAKPAKTSRHATADGPMADPAAGLGLEGPTPPRRGPGRPRKPRPLDENGNPITTRIRKPVEKKGPVWVPKSQRTVVPAKPHERGKGRGRFKRKGKGKR